MLPAGRFAEDQAAVLAKRPEDSGAIIETARFLVETDGLPRALERRPMRWSLTARGRRGSSPVGPAIATDRGALAVSRRDIFFASSHGGPARRFGRSWSGLIAE